MFVFVCLFVYGSGRGEVCVRERACSRTRCLFVLFTRITSEHQRDVSTVEVVQWLPTSVMPSTSLTILSLPNATGMRNGASEVTAYPALARQFNISMIERLSAMQVACVSPPSADAAWIVARSRIDRRSKASIGVLGCSTTAGCGALSPLVRCSMPLSWGRHAHDALASAMREPSVRVETSIFQKNSVEANFFLGCTRELLPVRPDVVVVEVLQNVYNGDLDSLVTSLVGAIRDAAPGVPILFLAWLSLHKFGEGPGHLMPQLRRLAATLGFDVADVPAALRRGLSVNSVPWHTLSAKDTFARTYHGLDHHPNALGHDLLGNLAALCIARRLKGPPRIGSQLGGAVYDRQQKQLALGSLGEEQCYVSADTMPVVARGGFVLQDDGGLKGVKKLGYSSRRVGDTLTLGPLEVHPRVGEALDTRMCLSVMRVRLGYLISTHPGMGELHAQCVGGCSCRPIKSTFMRRELPFPRFSANARSAMHSTPGQQRSTENVTMTAHTFFIANLLNQSNDACRVLLRHKAAPLSEPWRSLSGSRVRVDSMTIMRHGGALSVPCGTKVSRIDDVR